MSKHAVYIVNNSGHDFSNAKRFGELIIMSEGVVDKFNITKMLRLFQKHLKISKSEDYILCSGPSVMNAIACADFASRHGCLNLLLWRFGKDGDDMYSHHKVVLCGHNHTQTHTLASL